MTGTFHTTRWSLIAGAGAADEARRSAALGELCAAYWKPLYAFLRARGRAPQDSADLVQDLFAKLLEKPALGELEPGTGTGRFRNWLLTVLVHHERDVRDHGRALRRGGGASSISINAEEGERRFAEVQDPSAGPEELFERAWVQEVLENARQVLENEHIARGKRGVFAALSPLLTEEVDPGARMALAKQLDLSPVALRVALHRMKARYRELILELVRETLNDPSESADELDALIGALAR